MYLFIIFNITVSKILKVTNKVKSTIKITKLSFKKKIKRNSTKYKII